MIDFGRIQKELKEIERDKASGVTIKVVGASLQKLVGYVKGPRDTPYEGGVFIVDIELGNQYPFVPPIMRFRSRVWHPNVSSANGAICLDILKDQWSPALTLKTALLSLQALLASPEPNDPQARPDRATDALAMSSMPDAVVAKQYISEPETFAATARVWTQNFASQAQADAPDAKVLKLVEMGFDEAAAAAALSSADGDENLALEKLLGS